MAVSKWLIATCPRLTAHSSWQMIPMRDFKKLEIWKNAYSFAISIYNVTSSFPKTEQFGLTSQLRRASTSISANIAEGCGRGSKKDFLLFLYHAYGSIKECENFTLLSKDLGYIIENDYTLLANDLQLLSRMLNAFIYTIQSDIKGSQLIVAGPLPTATGSLQ